MSLWAREMAQGAKMPTAKSDNLSLLRWDPQGGMREPTPESGSLTSTHAVWCMCVLQEGTSRYGLYDVSL